MKKDNREQPRKNASQDYSNTRHDERDMLISPDDPFPVDTNDTGENQAKPSGK